MKSIYVQSLLTIFAIFNIVSITHFFFQDGTYHLFVIITFLIWIYIILSRLKIKNLIYKYPLTIILLIMLAYISLYSENIPLIIKSPFLILFSFIFMILLYFHYIVIFMLIVSLIFIFYIKKQIYLNIIFVLLVIILLNIRYVFIFNQSYNQKVIKGTSDMNTTFCIQEIFYDSNDYGDFSLYKYHTPKSNLFLPTLGIRYKTMYKEERGYIVVYEKRSYFNLYVGDGKVLCKSDSSSIVETLE